MIENWGVKTAIKNSFTKDIFKPFLTCFCHYHIPQCLVSSNSVVDQAWFFLLNFKKYFSFYAEHHHYDHSWHNRSHYYLFPQEKDKSELKWVHPKNSYAVISDHREDWMTMSGLKFCSSGKVIAKMFPFSTPVLQRV